MKRGELYWANLNPVIGSEQGGIRPVLIVQNRKGNHCAPTVTVCTITHSLKKRNLPTHVCICEPLGVKSVVQCEQLRTVDKSRILKKIGKLKRYEMKKVDKALKIQLELH